MNIQEYISSGVIEAYAAGIASAAEASELELLVTEYPEIADALDEAFRVMEEYASAHAVTPPPGLRQAILSQISQETTARQPAAPILPPENKPAQKVTVPVASVGFWKYAAAASVALLIASGLGNIYLANRNKDSENRLSAMHHDQDQMMMERNMALQQKQESVATLKTMTSANTQRVEMAGLPNHTDKKATLYWNKVSGDVLISVAGLPELPYGEQYQLWAIVDGKPVNAGLIAPSGSLDLLKMEHMPKAEMFAITIEHVGGSTVPTLDQMVVAGKPS